MHLSSVNHHKVPTVRQVLPFEQNDMWAPRVQKKTLLFFKGAQPCIPKQARMPVQPCLNEKSRLKPERLQGK